MDDISRRDFLVRSGALSLGLAQLAGANQFPGFAQSGAQEGAPVYPAPFFDLADDWLVTIPGQQLRFGSSVGPFKDPVWTLNECKDIGFTSIRIDLPREHCERGPNDGPYDSHLFHNPYPEATQMIREAKFDVIMLVKGHPANRKEVPQEWPRYPDGTIDGKAAAQSFSNYARWLSEHTRDFVHTYELWNEAFGQIEDQKFKKSFGPGGSKQNADNYADMMLPAMAQVKRAAPQAKTIIEGNYWNIAMSVAHSPGYQELLSKADYVVKHPYGYGPKEYTKAGKSGKGGWDYEAYAYFKSVNPKIQWIYTEYNVTAKGLDLTPLTMNGVVQAKGVLRATALHMRHGVTKLFPFALCYPPSPEFTFTEKDHTRRTVWFAMKRFMAACAPMRPSVKCKLERKGLPETMRDLAVATPDGFTYCIWQETKPPEWKNDVPPVNCTLKLKSSDGRALKVVEIGDPISGKEVTQAQVHANAEGELVVSLPVTDYPRLCFLKLIG